MTHLEIENLASDYLEGLLVPAQRASVEAHVNECESCRALLDDVRGVLELCRAAEDAEPRPWLVSKIMMATVGEHKLSWRERMSAFFRPVLQPRVAYPIAMTIFTFSVIVNAAGLSLRSLRFEDLNPRTWVARANRQGHLMAARAQKFYCDLRVVYEIESQLRQLGRQPANDEEETPRPAAPGGSSSVGAPPDRTVASNLGPWAARAVETRHTVPSLGKWTAFTVAERSLVP